MILRTPILLGSLALAFTASVAVAQQKPVGPMPEDTKAIRASGVGLRVSNLERSMKFYTEVLGFKVATRVPATGEVKEYLLGLTGDRTVDTLVVLSQGEVQPGATTFGRIVLVVPSGRKMAERVAASGVALPNPAKDGTNIVKDPDGYVIELYQRPAAPVAPAAPAR